MTNPGWVCAWTPATPSLLVMTLPQKKASQK